MVERRSFLIGGGSVVALASAGAAYAVLRTRDDMADYQASVAAVRRAIKQQPDPHDLIRYATLAANSHNSQPWRFRVAQSGIDIMPDPTRRLSAVDPDDHHLFASLGCAAENLSIAATMRGMPGTLAFAPAEEGTVRFEKGGGAPAEPALFGAIPTRQSTRAEYNGKTVSAADLATLASAAAIPGVDLVLITDRPKLNQIRDLVMAGNSAQVADAAFIRELKAWLRFSPAQALKTGDGLFSATSGNPALPEWIGPTMFDLVFKAKTENA